VYDQLRVNPSTLTCADIGGTFYELLHVLEGGEEIPICWGRVFPEDKTTPTITNCPSSPLYVTLEPNTELTITPADLGVTATDNCTVTLVTDPDPFVVTSSDNGKTLPVDVIASDESGNSAVCTAYVTVTVNDCSTGAEAPENLTVTRVDPDVVFTWDPVPGATDYAIGLEYYMINKQGKGKWKAVNGLPPVVSATTYSIPLADLDGATRYRFTVAVSGGGSNCTAVIEFVPDELEPSTLALRAPATPTGHWETQRYQVYPNPAKHLLQLDFSEALPTPRQIWLVDLQGRTVREQVASADAWTVQLNVEGLATGVYILHVQDGIGIRALKVLVE